jgi:hypothetical protein
MDRGQHRLAIARRVGGGIMSMTVDAQPEQPTSIDLEPRILGDAGEALYAEINACRDDAQLDRIASRIWHIRSQDQLTDAAADYLQHCVIRRRPPSGTKRPITSAIHRLAGRLSSRFAPRKTPRSPDREASSNRRRMLGGSSALPDKLRQRYTEGNRAVLCIVAGEIKRHGICDLPIDKIAALAGVCRTSVQNALHEARRLRHVKIVERPRPGRKHLPNIVEIVAPEWIAWIKRSPSASAARTIGSKPVKMVSTTKSKYKKKEAQQSSQRTNGSRPATGSEPGKTK